MTQKLDQLQAALTAVLGERIRDLKRELGEITITVAAADLVACAQTLRDHTDLAFEQLIDLAGMDMSGWKDAPHEGLRYVSVIHLLSVAKNWRLRVKTFAPDDEVPVLPSVTPIWSSANWFEREAFDMVGIIYEGHDDLRRILTDYGFIGHPLRKDFPVSGHVEMRYDEETRRVVYQPVTIEPREITPRVIREDHYGGL
ncbi:MAG: NADH-quinone oxidoreductase subunit C [Proteobacteria bacterium]|nr:NADH-quinone oxidoreductase subunit C [Pseudomonadota bacterium]